MADGVVRAGVSMQADESLLTGESEPVDKQVGGRLLSGSFVVAGSGSYQATAVGADAYARKLAAEARRFALVRSELMDGINQFLRYVSWAIAAVAVLVVSQLHAHATVSAIASGRSRRWSAWCRRAWCCLPASPSGWRPSPWPWRRVLVQQLPVLEGLAWWNSCASTRPAPSPTGPPPCVLALKLADIGIAMGSGAPAIKAVAELVLLDLRRTAYSGVLAVLVVFPWVGQGSPRRSLSFRRRGRVTSWFWDYVFFMDRPHGADGRALLTYVVGPALALWGLILAMGFAITGPLAGPLRAEYGVNKRLAADRSGTWNTITLVLSYLGSTEIVIGFSLIVAALVLWRTRDWRLAAVPAIAILLETAIFLSISSLVDRVRPQVDKLDLAPPTSSYPSGHVGASTALYLAFAFLALRIERAWLRWTTIIASLVIPLLVAFARLYRGMHYVTDVAAGIFVGIVCALLAYGWYRNRAHNARVPAAIQHRR